ncbi:MAG: 23S rRNA (uracil(1939)-C(5))-methyltransferase RlmD [Clostridia bacterium]|nr:23S rRNA (uracil(1939)-C(5))-methyltransferase RlmD [Clostridia bacterium]
MNNVKLTIDKLDDDLAGVCYQGAQRYVVDGALPKETVLVEPIQTVGTVTLARLRKVLVPSPDRVQADCAIYHRCGGCDLRHASEAAEAEYKTALLRRKLSQVDKSVAVSPLKSVAGLRNKVSWAFGEADGRVTLGFFDPDTKEVVDCWNCPAHGRWYTPLHSVIRAWGFHSGNKVYDPRWGKGVLRFAVARRLTGGLMVTIVATKEPKGLDELYTQLAKLSEHVSLWLNVNDRKTNEVFSRDFRHIAGDKRLHGSMLGVEFDLSPDSFFQTNTQVATEIYRDVAARLEGAPHVVDLYSGIGITSALLAKGGARVDSVEYNGDAVSDAKALARLNGVEDLVSVHRGKVQDVLPTLGDLSSASVLADPPRAGLGEAVCRSLLDAKPREIVYISCNPLTLAKDIAILSDGFSIDLVQPYNMFPRTKHVETLVLLRRRFED